jgi:rubrerythrin
MILIDRSYVTAAASATTAADLYEPLQNAIRLEHATIPPYLTAAYSLKPGANPEIRELIIGIAKQEMFHMGTAANLLNAIGGPVTLDQPGFIPTYPSPLPMSIGGGLKVGLKKFTEALVHDVFMEIEKPESPIAFPAPVALADDPRFATIGEFYRAVIQKIQELGNSIFTGGTIPPVITAEANPPEQLFAITDVETAVKALQSIVTEGEGTTTLPLESDGLPAHYYRFEQIYRGQRLVADAHAEHGYSYSGPAVPFDETGVWDLPDNPKAADYVVGTPERAQVDQFNQAYSDMLRLLQSAFSGHPEQIQAAQTAMLLVKSRAKTVVSTTDPNTGKQLGLPFELVPATR